VIDLEDDGMIELTVRAEGRVETQRLDLYECDCVIVGAVQKQQEEVAPVGSWMKTVREWLLSKGFPECSLRVVTRVANAVRERIGELEKKDGVAEKPNSSTSTESTSSD